DRHSPRRMDTLPQAAGMKNTVRARRRDHDELDWARSAKLAQTKRGGVNPTLTAIRLGEWTLCQRGEYSIRSDSAADRHYLDGRRIWRQKLFILF
ncbi:MAG: hypothetical protein AAGJ79_14410, partial [Verrucomicrobiota bacterium]